jgi:homogentisate 1,2-dioxygenase
MSEFMRRVFGVYDAKPDDFLPSGMNLHCMLHHGLDCEAPAWASSNPLQPSKLTNTLTFLLATQFTQSITQSRGRATDARSRLHALLGFA